MASTISAGITTTTALSYSADTSGVLQLQTNGTTTAVTIDTSQNVGVGVTPSAWGSSYRAFQFAARGVLANDSTDAGVISFGSNYYRDSGTNYVYLNSSFATRYTQYAGQHQWYTAASGTAGNAITFTQAMTLDANGNLGVGTTSPNIGGANKVITLNSAASTNCSYELAVNNVLQGSFYSNVSTSSISLGTFVNGPLTFITNSSERARIDTSGNLLIGYTSSNGSYKLQVNSQIFATSSTIATSDANYKENVIPLTNALDLVKGLNPVQFSWKQHPVHNFDTTTPTVGFIAQEVQATLSQMSFVDSVVKQSEVTLPDGTKEQFLGIAEGNMIAILTAALKELAAQVTILQTQVTALKG